MATAFSQTQTVYVDAVVQRDADGLFLHDLSTCIHIRKRRRSSW